MREQRVIDIWPSTPAAEEAESPSQADIGERVPISEKFARQVRLLYIMIRRELSGDNNYGRSPMPDWDGGETRFGVKKTAVWPRIARVILSIGADPVEYIRAQFHAKNSLDGKMPSPNYLVSNQAVERWQTYKVQARENVQRQLLSDANAIRNGVQPLMSVLHWSRKDAHRYVVRDKETYASPLYRYIVAIREELFEDSASLHDAALVQYMFQCDLYDSEWGAIVPDGLRQEARGLRSQLGCA